jgi:hypothetical protein
VQTEMQEKIKQIECLGGIYKNLKSIFSKEGGNVTSSDDSEILLKIEFTVPIQIENILIVKEGGKLFFKQSLIFLKKRKYIWIYL